MTNQYDNLIDLECCCCGLFAGRYEQWWNRDNGYGICWQCANEESFRLDPETMKSYYGIKGKHYS